MAMRKKLLSDSDIIGAPSKTYRRESIAEYLTSRRGSLSDLVSSSHQKLSRDSLLGNARMTRNASVSHQVCPVLVRDTKQRSNSLVASPSVHNSQSSIRESKYEHRSSTNIAPVGFLSKPFLKTRSLNSIQTDRNEEVRRNSKNLASKRRRLMKKIQSLKVFDSVLKGRQNRRRFEVKHTII